MSYYIQRNVLTTFGLYYVACVIRQNKSQFIRLLVSCVPMTARFRYHRLEQNIANTTQRVGYLNGSCAIIGRRRRFACGHVIRAKSLNGVTRAAHRGPDFKLRNILSACALDADRRNEVWSEKPINRLTEGNISVAVLRRR